VLTRRRGGKHEMGWTLSRRAGWVVVAALTALGGANPGSPAEQVGEAVLIKTVVSGDSGELALKSPVHRDERIRTSLSGLGQFIFRDGTKFAVGWGSSVVVDRFVFDDNTSARKLTINAAKGTFRWISGNSDSSAYAIVTPAGTLGVRGTAFDFYIAANGTTAVLLLNGSVDFCGRTGCKELKRPCEVLIATPRDGITDPRRAEPGILSALGDPRSLPFLTGYQELTPDFRANDRMCRLLVAGWIKVGPENPLPDDLKEGDEIEIGVGSALSARREIVAVGMRNGKLRYFISTNDSGWHNAITAYRRSSQATKPRLLP
jgi:hypothetical protein